MYVHPSLHLLLVEHTDLVPPTYASFIAMLPTCRSTVSVKSKTLLDIVVALTSFFNDFLLFPLNSATLGVTTSSVLPESFKTSFGAAVNALRRLSWKQVKAIYTSLEVNTQGNGECSFS